MQEAPSIKQADDISTGLPFKAVIFDMDGTLIASTEADFMAWKKLFSEYGQDLTYEKYFPLLGIKSTDVVTQTLHLKGEAAEQALRKKLLYFEEIVAVNGIRAIPSVEEFIKSIKSFRIKMALATSSRRPKMQLVMQQAKLFSYFDVIVTGEEISHGKPAPDIFLEAARKLGVAITDCIVFEDAVSGVLSAKKAGAKCVAITTTHTATALQAADIVIDSYAALSFTELCNSLC